MTWIPSLVLAACGLALTTTFADMGTLLAKNAAGECTDATMQSVVKDAMTATETRLKRANERSRRMRGKIAKTPFSNIRRFLRTKRPSAVLENHETFLEILVKKLSQKMARKMSADQINKDLDNKPACAKETVTLMRKPYRKRKCADSEFRSMDGSCNNLRNPLNGKSFTPFRRNLRADYSDWRMRPRNAQDGSELPSARTVSFNVIGSTKANAPSSTFMHVTYAQFLDHDLDLTALATTSDSRGYLSPVFCGEDGCSTTGEGEEECFPIKVPADDPTFSSLPCLEFVRSAGVTNRNNWFGRREQLNQLTSYIDASNVYGSTVEESNELRVKKTLVTSSTVFIRSTGSTYGAELRMSKHPIDATLKPLLPTTDDADACTGTNNVIKCFVAGDERVNEQVVLTVIHTLWAREHNRIVGILRKLNPGWSEEYLFQKTRSIVGAMMQHIAYNEVLPIFLGKTQLAKYGTLLQQSGYFTGYDSRIDAGVSNVFATAAYRCGHSLLPSKVDRSDKTYTQNSYPSLDLTRLLFSPKALYDTAHDGSDGFIRGMMMQNAQNMDASMTEQVTKHLFTLTPPNGLGTDLVALNIQRGRDHGIPSYTRWRRWCGLSVPSSFLSLNALFRDRELWSKYSYVYKSVHDIDLFPAGLAEKPVPGGLVGETFACILGREFNRLRKGDRYWYENQRKGGLTPAQLTEIRKASFARVICDNGDDINRILRNVMLSPGTTNKLVPCSAIPKVNLKSWV